MKKKIGICTGNISIGGQERMLIEFLKILSPEKYDINLFIEEDKGENNFYIKEIPEYVNYKFLTDKKLMERIDNYKKDKSILKKIIYSIDLMRKKKIAVKNLIKYGDDRDVLIDYNLGLLRTVHNLNLDNKQLVGWSHAGEGQILKNKRKNRNMNLYDYIVSVNENMRIGYQKNYSSSKTKMLTIENFVDESNIKRLAEKKLEEKSLGNFILSAGSLTENKDYESLIIGYSNFLKISNSELNLVVLGEGRCREALERLVEGNRLENRVFLLGNKSNPYKYIKRCSYYIQSSRNESFSLVLVEAMVFGKVLISTRNIGSNLVLENGEHGVLLGDMKSELSEKLNAFENDENLKKCYSQKSLLRGKDYSREKMQKKVEEFLDIL
ncbi:MAG: glycosyltransferase [Fusobacteriaceae bacterium]